MTKSNKYILTGGLGIKDDPDKIDKNDFDVKQEEEDIEEDIEEDVDEEKEEEEEGEEEIEEAEEEKEAFYKEADEEEIDGEECLYNITKKKNTIDIDLEEGEDNFEDEEIEENKKISPYVKPEERITKPFLFDFERVRILGERAKQISMGAKPMIKNIETYDPKRIAKMELEQKVLPLIILRELPDGRIEKWKVSELQY